MVLNAYTVLALFLVLLRCLLGLLVLWLSIATWRQGGQAANPEMNQTLENRGYLLTLLAYLLLLLNVLSWPIFYLLLQSYVAEWPGIMCIYGVTRIGTGSVGPSRFLPVLVQTLQVTKPLLVFLAGAWFVLVLINRRTATAPLRGRVLLTLMILGCGAVADAALEAGYLIIPKKEEFLSSGCCTEAFDAAGRSSRFVPQALFGEEYYSGLTTAFYGVNLGMVLALFLFSRRWPLRATRQGLMLLVLGALVSLPISVLFLVEIAAPALLHLPFHHCPYDLLPQVPESMAALALYLMGSFAVGWAALAGWLGHCSESRPFLGNFIRRILLLGLVGYAGALVMMFWELTLAATW